MERHPRHLHHLRRRKTRPAADRGRQRCRARRDLRQLQELSPKIAYQDKDPRVDPVADDLATLALDLLVDEAGFGRSGPNLLLFGAGGSA